MLDLNQDYEEEDMGTIEKILQLRAEHQELRNRIKVEEGLDDFEAGMKAWLAMADERLKLI
jgi:hypothetical protein